jgi:hypothetical protein
MGNKRDVPGHCDNQSDIVPEGTPDLSGRALNYPNLLPHECGVPTQCPGESREGLCIFTFSTREFSSNFVACIVNPSKPPPAWS